MAAGDPWRYVDILTHFPEIEIDGKIFIDVDGVHLTREDVVSRWAAHCDEAGKCVDPEPEKGRSPSSRRKGKRGTENPPSGKDLAEIIKKAPTGKKGGRGPR
jgi:hypothetical protein